MSTKNRHCVFCSCPMLQADYDNQRVKFPSIRLDFLLRAYGRLCSSDQLYSRLKKNPSLPMCITCTNYVLQLCALEEFLKQTKQSILEGVAKLRTFVQESNKNGEDSYDDKGKKFEGNSLELRAVILARLARDNHPISENEKLPPVVAGWSGTEGHPPQVSGEDTKPAVAVKIEHPIIRISTNIFEYSQERDLKETAVHGREELKPELIHDAVLPIRSAPTATATVTSDPCTSTTGPSRHPGKDNRIKQQQSSKRFSLPVPKRDSAPTSSTRVPSVPPPLPTARTGEIFKRDAKHKGSGPSSRIASGDEDLNLFKLYGFECRETEQGFHCCDCQETRTRPFAGVTWKRRQALKRHISAYHVRKLSGKCPNCQREVVRLDQHIRRCNFRGGELQPISSTRVGSESSAQQLAKQRKSGKVKFDLPNAHY